MTGGHTLNSKSLYGKTAGLLVCACCRKPHELMVGLRPYRARGRSGTEGTQCQDHRGQLDRREAGRRGGGLGYHSLYAVSHGYTRGGDQTNGSTSSPGRAIPTVSRPSPRTLSEHGLQPTACIPPRIARADSRLHPRGILLDQRPHVVPRVPWQDRHLDSQSAQYPRDALPAQGRAPRCAHPISRSP